MNIYNKIEKNWECFQYDKICQLLHFYVLQKSLNTAQIQLPVGIDSINLEIILGN